MNQVRFPILIRRDRFLDSVGWRLFLKTLGSVGHFFFAPEAHLAPARRFEAGLDSGVQEVGAQQGASALFGFGFSPGRRKYPAGFSSSILAPRGSQRAERYWQVREAASGVLDLGPDFGLMISNEWSVSASFSDQTF